MTNTITRGVDLERLVQDLADEFVACPLDVIRDEVLNAEALFVDATVFDHLGVLVARIVRARLSDR